MIAWTCGALACASIGRPPRQIGQLVADWLPIVLVLGRLRHDRGAADSLGIGVHAHPMIDFDRFVFFGDTPTQWLQAHLNAPGVVNGWDVAFTLVYTSYFIVPFAVAGALWIRDRLAFLRFARRLVTLALAGVADLRRLPGGAARGWRPRRAARRRPSDDVGGLGGDRRRHRRAVLQGPGGRQPGRRRALPARRVLALVAIFLWRRVRPWLRPLLALYPLAMGLTLIATGEHYFFDILLGWLYAAAVTAAWAWWERRRRATTAYGAKLSRGSGAPVAGESVGEPPPVARRTSRGASTRAAAASA